MRCMGTYLIEIGKTLRRASFFAFGVVSFFLSGNTQPVNQNFETHWYLFYYILAKYMCVATK